MTTRYFVHSSIVRSYQLLIVGTIHTIISSITCRSILRSSGFVRPFNKCFFSGFFAGHDPTRGLDHVVFKMSGVVVGLGRVRKSSKSHESGGVGSRGF